MEKYRKNKAYAKLWTIEIGWKVLYPIIDASC